jgi:hypothetical protein
VCETERFPTEKKHFSDGAWCVERFHDRPFQDFVAHETHRLTPANPRDLRNTTRSENGLKFRTFTSGASASSFQYNGPGKMFYVSALFAFPPHRMLLVWLLNLL